MALIVLTTLICLATLSAATCPASRPLTAYKVCQTGNDCNQGKSCCQYSDAKYCVSTDPNTCISEGKKVKKGESITLKDNCTTCTCYGYDDLVCTDDACIWPKDAPQMPRCPIMKPFKANTRCIRDSECSSGYTCCEYSEGHFCTLADPTICFSKGKKLPIGNMVTLDDGCSECECQGHDSFLCTNDGCVWPEAPKKSACDYGGKIRKVGSTFPSTDGCNTCLCSSSGVLCTLRGCIKFPFDRLHGKKLL